VKRNGMYSASIALIAVVIITALAFNSIATVKSQEGKSLAREMIEVKWASQNAEYLLEKSAADAFADAIPLAPPCDRGTGLVESYLNATLADVSEDLNCKIILFSSINIAGPNATIDLELRCGRSLGTGFVNYEKELEIWKTVTVDDDGISCFVDVEDKKSGECEVDTIPNPSPPGCEP